MADLKDEGRIDRAKGRIRSTWADLTDNDIDQVKGDVERLVGTIKEKTGESVESIRSRLDELMGSEANGDHLREKHEKEAGHGQPGGTHYSR